MSLQGQLIDMPFEDLIELITYKNDITGTLFLENNTHQARLQVFGGELFYAAIITVPGSWEHPVMVGKEAFHSMSNWESASFTFERNTIHFETQNIFASKRDLMLENLFKSGGFTIPQPVQNPPEVVKPVAEIKQVVIQPVANYRSKLRDMELSVEDWRVLIYLDGINTIGQLAEISEINPQKVLNITQRLEKAGLVMINHSQSSQVANPFRSAPALPEGRKMDMPIMPNRMPQHAAPPPKYKPQPAKRGLIGSLIAVLRGQ